MPLFANFPMLPAGSIDDHARYLARFNYRYYCVSCIRNIESEKKMGKCVHCSGTNLILLMEKEAKEKMPWNVRIDRFIRSLKMPAVKTRPQPGLFSRFRDLNVSFSRPKEELPTR